MVSACRRRVFHLLPRQRVRWENLGWRGEIPRRTLAPALLFGCRLSPF